MVSPIVLGFNDGTRVVCQVYPDHDDHAASSSKTYDLLGRRTAKRAAGVTALAEAHLEGSRERERLMRRVRQADSSPPANVPAVRTTRRRPLSRGEGGRNDPADRKRNQESRL